MKRMIQIVRRYQGSYLEAPDVPVRPEVRERRGA